MVRCLARVLQHLALPLVFAENDLTTGTARQTFPGWADTAPEAHENYEIEAVASSTRARSSLGTLHFGRLVTCMGGERRRSDRL